MAETLTPSARLMMEMIKQTPGNHFDLLGIDIVDYGRGSTRMILPYQSDLVGNPATGALHGGVMTTLLDSCLCFAAGTMVDEDSVCPTLDLRIDYMAPAQPGLPVYAEAEVYRVSRQVVFVRGKAYQEDNEQPVAYAVGTFARLKEVNLQQTSQVKGA